MSTAARHPFTLRRRTIPLPWVDGCPSAGFDQVWSTGSDSVAGVLWDGGMILAQTLAHLRSDTDDGVWKGDGHRWLELGAGCSALPSLVVTRMCAPCEMVVTDLEDALPLLRRNLDGLRAIVGDSTVDALQLRSLVWSEANEPSEYEMGLGAGSFDVVMGADVAYYTETHRALLCTARRMLRTDGRFLLHLKERQPDDEEDLLQDLVPECGFVLEQAIPAIAVPGVRDALSIIEDQELHTVFILRATASAHAKPATPTTGVCDATPES